MRAPPLFTWQVLSSFAPGEYDDAGDLDLLAEVDHPDGPVDVEVVEDGAGVERSVGDSVHCSAGASVLPARANVPLHMPTIADPRLLVVRHVFHCIVSSSSSKRHPEY